jgi:choline kinase
MSGSQVTPVLLAAGLGRRLGGVPKALYALGGETLAGRCARALEANGFASVMVITGHGAQELQVRWDAGELPLRASFVHNDQYAELNNFHTLAVACRAAPPGDILALNSDIVFDSGLIAAVLETDGDLALAVEPGSLDDEALKVAVDGDAVVGLGKRLDGGRAYGEFIGISRLSSAGRAAYLEAADRALRDGELDLYYEDVYSRICTHAATRLSNVAPGSWAEIDTPEDVPAAQTVAARQITTDPA